MTMNGFMPSEIARLVLGYLKESCVNASNIFLNECTHLKEYRECLRNGYQYPTDVAGKSLKAILNEYYCLKLTPSNVNNDFNVNNDSLKKTVESEKNEFEKHLGYINSVSAATENDDHLQPIRRKSSPKKKNYLQSSMTCSHESIVHEEIDECINEESVDVAVLLEQLMNNHALHEKIAENINKTVSSTSQSSSNNCEENHKELAIKEIVNRTESDPVFEECLTTFFDNLKNDSNLDETQLQIQCPEVIVTNDKCDNPLSDAILPNKIIENIEPNLDQPLLHSPAEIIGKVKSSNTRHESKAISDSPITDISLSITSPPQNTPPSELKSPCSISLSSKHKIISTPNKSASCLQLITISPGELDWGTLSNINLVLASPRNDILPTAEGRNNSVNNSVATTASPAQFLSAKNRVDCHIVRDLNFFESESTKIDRSPVLNTLVSSAKTIVQTDTLKATHIRALEFKTPKKIMTKEKTRTVQKIDKTIVKTVNADVNRTKDFSVGKKRKPLPMNRKLKKPKTNIRMGFSNMDVEKFLNNLCYVE